MTEGGAGPLVRKFVLKTMEDAQRFYAFLKANREPMMEQGRFLQVVVSEYKSSRSNEQNAYMWAGLLKPTAEQAWITGHDRKQRRYSDIGWNLILKVMFLPETNAKGMDKWFYLPNGERELVMSTSDLNVEEMKLYLNQCAEYVTHDLGVMLPVNPKDL
jgi:hypothetical protein